MNTKVLCISCEQPFSKAKQIKFESGYVCKFCLLLGSINKDKRISDLEDTVVRLNELVDRANGTAKEAQLQFEYISGKYVELENAANKFNEQYAAPDVEDEKGEPN